MLGWFSLQEPHELGMRSDVDRGSILEQDVEQTKRQARRTDRGNLDQSVVEVTALLQQTSQSGCVVDEACDTVIHSHFHARQGLEDYRFLHAHWFVNHGNFLSWTIEVDKTGISRLPAGSAEWISASSHPAS